CHIHDAGYDVTDFDAVLDEFDRVLGTDLLKVIHLNDSKNVRGARKDRHANIGKGEIGFGALYRIAHNARTAHLVRILETPYIKEQAPYGIEIDMLRSGVYEEERLSF
ncbi:MAG: TIM barrel protein, partial [Solobacterium sp.]|nr:TIM barrel protein [Solobacterium sp.]